jgi:hypothetical protein
MKYSKLLDVLENDTSLEDLRAYKNKTKKLDRRNVNKIQQKELLTVIIPKLIEQQEKEDTIMSAKWRKNSLLRLAFVRCLKLKHPIKEIFYDDDEDIKKYKHTVNFVYTGEVIEEIINRINEDDKSVAIAQRVKEYCKRYKDVEII